MALVAHLAHLKVVVWQAFAIGIVCAIVEGRELSVGGRILIGQVDAKLVDVVSHTGSHPIGVLPVGEVRLRLIKNSVGIKCAVLHAALVVHWRYIVESKSKLA